MSELQIGLLIIGIVVVLTMYIYGALQQRRYRRRFNSAFNSRRGDALYHSSEGTVSPPPAAQAMPLAADEEEGAGNLCSTLDASSDYIAEISLRNPALPGLLAPLWQQRFDFGKRISVCGLNPANGMWEKVMAESRQQYVSFKLALQLADRNGPVTEAQLGAFRNLVRDLARVGAAEASLPDAADAVARAGWLDTFCAEVDHVIGLNILPGGDRLLLGSDVAQIAAQYELRLLADGFFHLLDAQGQIVFSLRNFDDSPFEQDDMDGMPVVGLSLQMDVPRVEMPARRFDELVTLARSIGEDLGAAVVDDHRMELGDGAIAMIRAQVAAIEKRMLADPIVPGSALARRVFS